MTIVIPNFFIEMRSSKNIINKYLWRKRDFEQSNVLKVTLSQARLFNIN